MKKSHYIADLGAFCLIVLFVYAASAKLMQWQQFRGQLEFYPWIRHFAGWVAWAVPLAELVITVLLLSSRRRIAGFYASLILLFIFTAYLSLMLGTEKHLPCSCGGVIAHLTWRQHIVFNSCFMIAAGLAILAERGFFHHHKTQMYET